MKVGILSLKYKINYGGILQSLALQKAIEDMGHEVEIINYSSTIKESFLHRIIYGIFNLFLTKNIFVALKDRKKEQKKETGIDSTSLIENCEAFMSKHLKRGKLVNEKSIASYCKKFDCIIVGSDQIWSVTNSSKLIYFFDWEYQGKKISYAACSVNAKPAFLNRLKIKRLLKKFNSVSVRDNTTSFFVSSTAKITPSIVSDPTFLYNFDQILDQRMIPEPYILTYILGDEINGGNSIALETIKNICPKDTKVISIVIPSVSKAGKNGADIVITNADPQMWINLIKYAVFVYTDSFHGVVFSLKYNKKFIGYYSYAKRATRLMDLAKRYKLNNIVANAIEIKGKLDNYIEPDYNLIEQHIKESKQYLYKTL